MSRLANYRPRRGATHQVNPAGSKLLRRFFKAKNYVRASAAKAADWYAGYLAEKDRAARERERELKLSRTARSA